MEYEVKIKKLPKSEVEMEVSLPSDFLASARKKALNNFALSTELPGFRKGHVPENIIIEKIGESNILEEAADMLLREHFPKIASEKKLDIIGQPKISIKKLALGNPFDFVATFAIMPEFELPNYKKIASDSAKASQDNEDKIEATQKEIDDVLLQIRKNKAHFDFHKNNPEINDHDHKGFNLEDEKNLPPLDDNLAKEAGNFENLEDLKKKVAENIAQEKKYRNIEKKRALIMEELIKATKIDLPDILVENETKKSLAQMKDDIDRMKGKWEEYLSHIKKTEDDLKKELGESSEKKAKIQLIFNKIAEVEKIQPDKEILENEIKHIKEHHKEASEESARIYVSTILLNQEVLKLLENQK